MLNYQIESPTPDEYCNGSFVPKFHPAHFTCMSCDTTTCPDCNSVMCDLSQCIGKFYTQECWCRPEADVKDEMPMFMIDPEDGKEVLSSTIQRYSCEDDCSGNLCDTEGLVCRKAQEACRPWWWCDGVEPPKTDTLTPGSAFKSFLQRKDLKHRSRAGVGSATTSARQLQQRVLRAQEQEKLAAAEGKKINSIADLAFKPSRYVCSSASLPPKVKNPKTLLYVEPGYIVFDKSSCEGGGFTTKCSCWDPFLYYKGEDPKVSVMECDPSCSSGGCDGRHCAKKPPPDLPEPKPEPPDPFRTESTVPLNNMDQPRSRLTRTR